jgi:DNA-binding protein WhiA
MSFSSDIKDELSRHLSNNRHCRLAELASIIELNGKLYFSESGEYTLKLTTENIAVARKYFTMIKKTFNIITDISIKNNVYLKKSRTYTISINNHKDARRVLQAAKFIDRNGEVSKKLLLQDKTLIMNSCCKRAFIRGAFLASGSISDPERFYHLELVTQSREKALMLQSVIQTFQIDAKIVKRKNNYVVYIKESESIVNLLNIMEAHVALMNFENIRILKEMRNSVNRKVNCETANINKTVSAAIKQIEDINYIEDTVGLSYLSENLKEVALLRLANPDISLKELGTMLNPPIGKSGVNHRLRKICDIADSLKEI